MYDTKTTHDTNIRETGYAGVSTNFLTSLRQPDAPASTLGVADRPPPQIPGVVKQRLIAQVDKTL